MSINDNDGCILAQLIQKLKETSVIKEGLVRFFSFASPLLGNQLLGNLCKYAAKFLYLKNFLLYTDDQII